MTLLFSDGFDQYGTDNTLIHSYWSAADSGAIALVAGRFAGSRAIQFTAPTTQPRSFANAATLVYGCALRRDGSGNDSFPPSVAALVDGATVQLQLGIDAGGRLIVKRGQNGTTIATSSSVLSVGVWYHVELKATIHPSAGVVEVRVNGSSVGWIPQTTGLNTRNTANNFVNGVLIIGNIAGAQITLDDLYVLDTTGVAPLNDFIGDCRIETKFPNVAGTFTQWTPNGEAVNFQCVDNNPPIDTTFVSDSTPLNRDLYGFTDLSASFAILAATVLYRASKSDAGSRSISPQGKSGLATLTLSAIALGTSFLWYPALFLLDPNGAVPWTLAALNAAEFGQRTEA